MKVFFDIGFHDSTNPDGIARYTRELIRSFKTIGQNEIYFIRRSAHIYLAQSRSDPSIFDQPLVINSGDLLIMPSLDTGLFEASSYLFSLRAIGVSIISLIPDLIAVDYPEFFPAGNNQIILRTDCSGSKCKCTSITSITNRNRVKSCLENLKVSCGVIEVCWR